MKNNFEIQITPEFHENELKQGIWIAIIHATRIPPHIGLIINGAYHSLTIKGQEINIAPAVMLKNIGIRKIPSFFCKIKPHPVFSLDYLNDAFVLLITKHPKVSIGGATCFTPVKEFFTEFYCLHDDPLKFVFNLFPELYENDLIIRSHALNLNENSSANSFMMPTYNAADVSNCIHLACDEIELIKDNQ